MALENSLLENFFKKQKKASIDALIENKEVINKNEIKDEDKTTEKRKQSVSKSIKAKAPLKIDSLANREQNDSKTTEKRKQSVSKSIEAKAPLKIDSLANREQNSSETLDKALATRKQNRDSETSQILLEGLVGKEKSLVMYLFKKCHSQATLETPIINTEEIKELLSINSLHVRNLIHRITQKGIVEVSFFKKGRLGLRKFKFTRQIFQFLYLNFKEEKTIANCEQDDSKSIVKSLVESLASGSSSSSYKNSTTEGNLTRFESLNIEPLIDYGFSNNHLRQLEKLDHLTEEGLQASIQHFAFDLNKNGKAKEIRTSPINYFMGILRNEGVYNAPPNYESPRERALREYQENKKREEERLKTLLGDEYKSFRNKKIKEIFESLQEEIRIELSESFKRNMSGVGIVLFRQEGLENPIALEDFSDFVMTCYADLFKEIPSLMKFCDMKLANV